jgi:uncharacterized SAM-binding protein YcdF (DUF218 family)
MILRRAARVIERLLALVGLVLLLVLTTPLVSWWARAYSGPIEQPKGDILIVLSAANDDNGGISYSSYWRARQAIYAWQHGSFSRIIISGGAGPGIFNYLTTNGVPASVIIADPRSGSTRQSGVEVAHLLENIPGKKVLLTSEFHMFRALRVFRKLGVDVAPMAVPDVLHSTEHWPGRFIACWQMVVETTKIAYYAFHGWI